MDRIKGCDIDGRKKPRRSGAFYGQGLPERQLPVGLLIVINISQVPLPAHEEFGEFVMLK